MTPHEHMLDALTTATGTPAGDLPENTLLLDLGVDSLGLADLVDDLQRRLGVIIPDEVTARIHTIGRLHAAVGRLLTGPEERVAHYLRYLTVRPPSPNRGTRFAAAANLLLDSGLDDVGTVVDVAAGWTELDVELRARGWRGRYVPVDAAIDGTDVETWEPPSRAEWFVALEILEHLDRPARLVRALVRAATRGVLVSTPNPDVIDVLAMCPDHWTPVGADELTSWGFKVEARTLYRFPSDGLFAYRYVPHASVHAQ